MWKACQEIMELVAARNEGRAGFLRHLVRVQHAVLTGMMIGIERKVPRALCMAPTFGGAIYAFESEEDAEVLADLQEELVFVLR